jgi:hypothetical protein
MILRHFTKAHYLLSIISSQTIRREQERHLRIDRSWSREDRRLEYSMLKKIPAFTWLTVADRANTSFACCDMSTGVKFREAFCIEIDKDDVNAVNWREYETLLRRKKHLGLWVTDLNEETARVGDNKRDYYVVKGDIDLSKINYRVKLMQYDDGVDFANYMRSNLHRFEDAAEIADSFDAMKELYEQSNSTYQFEKSVIREVANDEFFTQVA